MIRGANDIASLVTAQSTAPSNDLFLIAPGFESSYQPTVDLNNYRGEALECWLTYYFVLERKGTISEKAFWGRLDKELTQEPFSIGKLEISKMVEKLWEDLAFVATFSKKNQKHILSGIVPRRRNISPKKPPTDTFANNLGIYWAFTRDVLDKNGREISFVDLFNMFLEAFSGIDSLLTSSSDGTLFAASLQPFAKEHFTDEGVFVRAALFPEADQPNK